ncbi:MAG: hypothetical protein ACXVFQ_09920 [Solirubrobacteraceae bacterium]
MVLTVRGQADIRDWLQAIAAALNDARLDDFELARVQPIVDGAGGDLLPLIVDEGGGLHDRRGTRVGAIRRAPSGEWIIDGQNADAARADAEIPAAKHDHHRAQR